MRLVKLMIKVTAIFIGSWLFVTIILVAEAHILFGESLPKVMKGLHGISRGSN